jgi:hypothetical protein
MAHGVLQIRGGAGEGMIQKKSQIPNSKSQKGWDLEIWDLGFGIWDLGFEAT